MTFEEAMKEANLLNNEQDGNEQDGLIYAPVFNEKTKAYEVKGTPYTDLNWEAEGYT